MHSLLKFHTHISIHISTHFTGGNPFYWPNNNVTQQTVFLCRGSFHVNSLQCKAHAMYKRIQNNKYPGDKRLTPVIWETNTSEFNESTTSNRVNSGTTTPNAHASTSSAWSQLQDLEGYFSNIIAIVKRFIIRLFIGDKTFLLKKYSNIFSMFSYVIC